MKNNFVKILATLGLIIAIALILRGVFDVGKIGFKKLKVDSFIVCQNTKNDEIIKIQLNEKDKVWTDNWGKILDINEWNKNKIVAIDYSWVETPLSDGTTKKSPITKIDHILYRVTGRLEVNHYPPKGSFFQLNYNCSASKKNKL